jgi:outer membrane protein OmpA-like peptidoglycan-associated protein
MLKRCFYFLSVFICLTSAFAQDTHPVAGTSCDCCAKKPNYDPSPVMPAPPYPWSLFTGQIAVVTQQHGGDPGPLSNRDLVVWNLANRPAPVNTWWNPGSLPVATQYYSDPRWDAAHLGGDVFGLTLDSHGNIYVASTAIYGTPATGQIYKIANGTGTPSPFGAALPNSSNGLGNLAYDCKYDSFYVTDFYDGLIYRLDASGVQMSTWNHGLNLPTAVDSSGTNLGRPAITGKDGSSTYSALGERPWAVRTHSDPTGHESLFYSNWNQDSGRHPGAGHNEIWSIALDGNGDPVPPARLEIVLPSLSGQTYSNPVSDISFTPMGTMLVAERGMGQNNATNPHVARVLEYSFNGLQWVPSLPVYKVGIVNWPNPTNASGGVDSNFSTGEALATGDALHLNTNDNIYGIQGFPVGGGDVTNSFLIDADDYVNQQNKTQIGDVKVPCPDCTNPPAPPVITGPQSMCVSPSHYTITPQAGVTYTWTVTGGTASATSGSAIDVNWSSAGPGSIKVTASGPAGCGEVTSTIQVSSCNINCTYCSRFNTSVVIPPPIGAGGGLESVTPTVSSNMPNLTSITETLLNASVAYTPASCGVSGPRGASIAQAFASTSPVFNPVLPVPNGSQAIWQSSTPIHLPGGGVNTPFQLQLSPAPLTNAECSATFSFCMRFSLADSECRNCDIIRCFGPFPYVPGRHVGGEINPDVPPQVGLVLANGTSIAAPQDSFLVQLAALLQGSGDVVEPHRFVIDHVKFEQDKAELTDDSRPTLTSLAAILKAYPGIAIRLEVHTDNSNPAAGKLLSLDRAKAVQNILQSEGVPADRITVEGFGSEKPLTSNDTGEGRAKNQRIELLIMHYVRSSEPPKPAGKKKLLGIVSQTATTIVSNTTLGAKAKDIQKKDAPKDTTIKTQDVRK